MEHTLNTQNKFETQAQASVNPLDVAARLRRDTQAPNATASLHEIHGEIGSGFTHTGEE